MKPEQSTTQTSALQTQSRYVPEHRIEYWSGKTKKYCVVIPVINEGQRIVNLLSRMQDCAISEVADILIVDGGSTDGSMETERLQSLQVRGLLTKTGPGKLSAQLLVAYAFAMEQGYQGVVTIDGNDKDEPSPIKDFIRHLDRGVDFVQASRFVPGGHQLNTPLSRNLAIKLLHAPALSIASGFKWTDTTQGFRAYSARLLNDPTMHIFRPVFYAYELLAYMNYRAPKLGFTCVEHPTSRVYPEGEIPTKIAGLRGNFELIKVLFKTCMGKYNNQ